MTEAGKAVISFRLPISDRVFLEDLAKKRGETLSDLVYRLVNSQIQNILDSRKLDVSKNAQNGGE